MTIDIRRIAEWLKNPAIPEDERQNLIDIAAIDRDANGAIESSEFAAQFPKVVIDAAEIEKHWKTFQARFMQITLRQDWRLANHDAREPSAICWAAQQPSVTTRTQTLSAAIFCDSTEILKLVERALQKLPLPNRPQVLYSCGPTFLQYLAHTYTQAKDSPHLCTDLYRPSWEAGSPCYFWDRLRNPDEEVRALATRSIGPTPDPQAQHDLLYKEVERNGEDSFFALRQVPYLPIKYRADIVQLGFKTRCETAAEQVQYLLPEERLGIMKLGLNLHCSTRTLEQLKYLSLKERLGVLESLRSSFTPGVEMVLLRQLEHLPLAMRLGMVQEGLKSDNPTLHEMAIAQVGHLPIKDRLTLVQKAFAESDEFVRRTAIQQVRHLPIPDRLALVEAGLEDDNFVVRGYATEQIRHLNPSDRLDLVEDALGDDDEAVRRNGVQQIPHLPLKDRLGLVEKALEDGTNLNRAYALGQVSTLAPSDRLKVVQTGLQDKESWIRSDAIRQAQYLSPSERRQIRALGLKDSDLEVRQAAQKI